jgi:hypothetical protein
MHVSELPSRMFVSELTIYLLFRSQDIGLLELRDLTDICRLLYSTKDSLIVVMKRPRHLRCEHIGKVCLTVVIVNNKYRLLTYLTRLY